MWDFIVFCVIGLLAGAAARLLYAGREPMKVLGTMVLGAAGAVAGGLISWAVWPAVHGQVYSAALLMSLSGAVLALVAWPCLSYARGSGMPLAAPEHSDPVLAAEVVRLDLRLKQANVETLKANGVAQKAILGEEAARTVEEEANRKLEDVLRTKEMSPQEVKRFNQEAQADRRQVVS